MIACNTKDLWKLFSVRSFLMENTQLQMVLSFKTSFCLHSDVLLWKQQLLKMSRHFYCLSVNFTSSPKQSFQTLQVRGSWKSSPLPWNPSDTSLSPLSSSSHVWLIKNTEPLRGRGVEGNTKRTNFGNKCFRVSIFHINYYFELCLVIFHPHIFHNMNSHSPWVHHLKKSTRRKWILKKTPYKLGA